MIGADPNSYPPGRQRALLLATPALHRKRGTAAGISLAIDVATNGLAKSGAVIVIEAFRLRHIFATILGADLSDTNDPLLPGYSGSSNSYVGDTTSSAIRATPISSPNLLRASALPSEATQVQAFLDSLAWRMIVFVHNQVTSVGDFGLINQIVAAEKPAHVVASVQVATQPFMIGLASLVGVNSSLTPRAAARSRRRRHERNRPVRHHPPHPEPRSPHGEWTAQCCIERDPERSKHD